MIGVDWGTSSFRAFRMDAQGIVIDMVSAALGILHVDAGGFEATLRGEIGPWLLDGERHVLLSGMVGSRQGWKEAPYCPCPAGAPDIAAALQPVPLSGAQAFIVPGLTTLDEAGTPEVMRGEETQIVGAGAEGLVCLPGSHAKWARVTARQIVGFQTFFSGEAFAALRGGTILGRMMNDAPHDPAAFGRGVARSADAGHMLHHLFGVRTLGLMGRLTEDASASYLSGLLIGHEVRAALSAGEHVTLLGAPTLCALYATAIAACGGTSTIGPADCAAAGLALIGASVQWN
jgi:2-dehydro-3-deoxygalactonokinase